VPLAVARRRADRKGLQLLPCVSPLLGHETNTPSQSPHVRFSNRRFRVKRFQTIHRSTSMSLAGSCFSSESTPGPFHHGTGRRGGTICWAALPSVERQDQADMGAHVIHRPARDILPLLGRLPYLEGMNGLGSDEARGLKMTLAL
jgi:hypothetical protein